MTATLSNDTALGPNPEADPAAWDRAHEEVRAFIGGPGFPCAGAKSAFNTGRYHFALFGRLGDRAHATPLCQALYRFIAAYPEPGTRPVTFVAAFQSAAPSEAVFEAQLWQQLQAMHEQDCQRFAWDPALSDDPQDPTFGFSVGGHGFFVVGLHPRASRWARRAPMDVLVFNLRAQFAALESAGKYESLESAIRQRDLALQGSLNPVLARHGRESQARQFSGRPVGADWVCPFHAKGARP